MPASLSFAAPAVKKTRFGLHEWIWRAFVRGALIPLILVELVLITVYLVTNTAIRHAQTDYLHQVAFSELEASAHRESHLINEQLTDVQALTRLYQALTSRALDKPAPNLSPTLALLPNGARYSPHDTGGAASFYSGITPPDQQNLLKVAQLSTLDPLMREIHQNYPLISSIYFNSWDSYNHIYPWFFTPDQYQHNLNIPEFNFYYQADAAHDPSRQPIWTDVYLDPAGQGWMMSSVAPVYRGDFLEGVVGLDITVSTLLTQIGHLNVPWQGYGVLISDQLNIMALPKSGEADFNLHELTQHTYHTAVHQEVLKPETFNLERHPETQHLAQALRQKASGVMEVKLAGQPKLVAWNTVQQTGWHLLMIVDEATVYQETNALSRRYRHIGYLMIAGLLLFYIIFFSFLWWRARRLSQNLLRPIHGIQGMMADIGRGLWHPKPFTSPIRELNDMARHTATMGQQLEQSEQQRRKIQQRLELVLDNASESLWERDLHTGRMLLRGHFCQRFGLPPEGLNERIFVQRIHPEDLSRFRAAQSRLQQEGFCEVEFRFQDSNDHYHWLLGRGQVVEYDFHTQKPRLLAGTYVDIDHIKQAEERLRQATLEAEAASQAKSRFISSVSHELRTPLNAIHGFAQLMQLEREAQPDLQVGQEREYLHEILMASQHLNALVNDILDWASIQAEKPKLDSQRIEVAHLLDECAELVRLEVARQGLTLTVEITEPNLQIETDPRRLRQVLLNLLSNAIKYNRPAGHITLSATTKEHRVRLMVQDNGWGIAPELQSKLFEPFQRLGQENTAIQGTGIGLSLCREFARWLGGDMGLHSEPNQGSCFWIELPLLESSCPSTVSSTPESAPSAAAVNMLCLSAQPGTQQLASQALAELGKVITASSAQEALTYAQTTEFRVLILDLELPDMTAEHFLSKLNHYIKHLNLSVILLIQETALDALMNLSFQGILLYPINPDDLKDQVAALLLHENS